VADLLGAQISIQHRCNTFDLVLEESFAMVQSKVLHSRKTSDLALVKLPIVVEDKEFQWFD
jgi:hypothetical protein